MAQVIDLVDVFSAGGDVVFDFDAKTRADAILPNAAAAVCTVVCRELPENGGGLSFEIDTAGAEVALTDAGNATFQVKPSAGNLALLQPGWLYQIDVWTDSSPEGRLHQLSGLFRLQDVGAPS